MYNSASSGTSQVVFDSVLKNKQDEIEKLKKQLHDLKIEHDKRQTELDELAS